MNIKRYLFCLLLTPVFVFAYDSVVYSPASPFETMSISEPSQAQELVGKLDDAPHTYQFTITQPTAFSARIYSSVRSPRENDVSAILVQEVKRGVSEIAKTHGTERSTDTQYDFVLAESFYDGGSIEAQLDQGTYRFEVSSPRNNALYRIVLHEEQLSYSYFDNLQRLFEIKKALGAVPFSAFISTLISIPLIVAIALYFLWRYYRKKHA